MDVHFSDLEGFFVGGKAALAGVLRGLGADFTNTVYDDTRAVPNASDMLELIGRTGNEFGVIVQCRDILTEAIDGASNRRARSYVYAIRAGQRYSDGANEDAFAGRVEAIDNALAALSTLQVTVDDLPIVFNVEAIESLSPIDVVPNVNYELLGHYCGRQIQLSYPTQGVCIG